MSAPRLLETMRAEGGRVPLLDRHLARLAASALAFGYPFVEAEVRGMVGAVRGDAALRLTLGAEGYPELDEAPLPAAPLRTVWIDPDPLAEAGTWRCTRKTTDRAHYAARRARAAALGADEAALVNAAGEVTEGTLTNVWARAGGTWWTPPLAAGGLGGVMRAHLLATRPDAAERPLTPGDLRAADALALSNALRGWMPVRLLEGGMRKAE